MTTTAPAPSPSLASTQAQQPHIQPQPQPQLQPPPLSHQQKPLLQQRPQLQQLPQQQHHHHHLPPPPPFVLRPQPAPAASTGPLQPLTPNVLHPPRAFIPPAAVPNPASPPNKRDLKSWWKGFILQSKNHDVPMQRTMGIFGVPLRESITYANVAISLIDDNGRSYIYGYVPIVVAKCGVFLKEKATGIEGIFRLSGSEKRIKELKIAFDSPERYGKGMSWNGYTVHDAANVLRRYLNDLPEPVVPLDFYEPFRDPLRHAVKLSGADSDGPQFVENFDMASAIRQYQRLITELPPLNRQLLLYILDLLAVFAAKSDVNRMNSQNLSAIFQPGLLSHPSHDMAPEEYRLNQIVLIFLIENQDHFLIGMQGTAADEQTVKDVQRGTPPVTPSIAMESPGIIGVTRTASNASAGAESVARDGKIRRNRSTSSRNSHHSNGNSNSHNHNHNHAHNHGHGHIAHTRPPTPRSSSPGLVATPTTSSSTSGGLARSNTLPARSPGLSPGRFNKRVDVAGNPVSPLTPITHHSPLHTPTIEPVEEVVTPAEEPLFHSPFAPAAVRSTPPPSTSELVVDPPPDATGVSPAGVSAAGTPVKDTGTLTPSKDRILSLFQRSQIADGEPRPPPNKLRKKRMPTSANPSAQSSTASLPPVASALAASTHELGTIPSESHATSPPPPAAAATAAAGATKGRISPNEFASHHKSGSSLASHATDSTPLASQVPSTVTTTPTPMAHPTPTPMAHPALDAAASEAQLRPQMRSPSPSLHSSFNGSEVEQPEESTAASTSDNADHSERAKKRNWRMSRRRDDAPLMGLLPPGSNMSEVSTNSRPALSVGSNANAELSTSSVCSGGPASTSVAALSQTGASGSSEPTFANAEAAASQDSTTTVGSSRDGRDGREGKLSGWLKNKYREAKENAEHRRTKSPTSEDRSPTTSLASGLARGKSLDLKRPVEEDKRSN